MYSIYLIPELIQLQNLKQMFLHFYFYQSICFPKVQQIFRQCQTLIIIQKVDQSTSLIAPTSNSTLKNIIHLPRQLEDMLSSDPSLTERMIIMVSWNDIFTFVIMLMAILTYIDTHRKHKKQPSCSGQSLGTAIS